MITRPKVLRFGIQSLDKLIGRIDEDQEIYGIDLSKPEDNDRSDSDDEMITSSICLIGPDGTGKSVFSLHIASQYLVDCINEKATPDNAAIPDLDQNKEVSTTPETVTPSALSKPEIADAGAENKEIHLPKVFYISSDLNYKMALKAWNNFALHYPSERREPLVELKKGREEALKYSGKISLQHYFPADDVGESNNIIEFMEGETSNSNLNAEVCFVDLASRTAGDDWGFVHRLLSTLEEPNAVSPRHLVILDAVEGFETLVGDLNAFGDKSSRRSRIAQVMRLAAGKCHLVFVVEEGRTNERFPEEFVTDVVIRLRNIDKNKYLRRTVEVEKTRGQWHIRGQHPVLIRNGRGSSTGEQINADEPEVPLYDSAANKEPTGPILNSDKEPGDINRNMAPSSSSKPERPRRYQSYVHVFSSLSNKSREIMLSKYKVRAKSSENKFAAFGIPYLDNMLGGSGEKAEIEEDYDTRGLPCGTTTALIGDALTQKSQLGKAFLSRPFYSYAVELAKGIREKANQNLTADLDVLIGQTIVEIAGNSDEKDKKISAVKASIQVLSKINAQIQSINDEWGKLYRPPVVIMYTTQDVNTVDLANEFFEWFQTEENILGNDEDVRKQLIKQRKEKDKIDESSFNEQIAESILDFVGRVGKYCENGDKKVIEDIYSVLKKPEAYKEKERFKEYLMKKTFENELKSYIIKYTICRRFEIHDLPGPILMDIFRSNIEKAQRIMFGIDGKDDKLPDTETRFQNSWRIRVVVDDLNTFRNTYPEIHEDPLMLPSLLFMLVREGVTSLIIDTQTSGSPELSITERFDSSVREFVQHRMYTWRLPFYGENRVAISLIPPISSKYRGIIRELRWTTRGKAELPFIVDPHFELYAGLEKGHPQPIPLEVRLYAETPNFKKYIETEEKFFREIFTPVVSSINQTEPLIINWANESEYDLLRDSCHLQRYTRMDHTTVLQVDEFWWLRPARHRHAGAFRQAWDYLNTVTTKWEEGKHKVDTIADPFEVFQPPPKSMKNQNLRKLDFFDNECGYDFVEISKSYNSKETFEDSSNEDQNFRRAAEDIDRVPFTWDFGFMLCNEKAWHEAFDSEISLVDGQRKKPKTIKEVWDGLCKTSQKTHISESPISWREFLGASKVVAEFQSYRTSKSATAFDFTMLMPESFSCLILEMWMSEIYTSLQKREEKSLDKEYFRKTRRALLDRVKKRRWFGETDDNLAPKDLLSALANEKGKTLEEILDERIKEQNEPTLSEENRGYSLELYKVWLLLIEVINFAELVDSSSHLNFEFKPRGASSQAVSSRHWYKTASKFIDSLTPEQLEYNWVPVRLPGNFSVRADWFLAVTGGSRSSRLADYALDLLSSQRANVTRLQNGIGLPTRKLFSKDKDLSRLRTKLISVPGKGKAFEHIEYNNFRKIGSNQQFYRSDFSNFPGFIEKIMSQGDSFSAYLYNQLNTANTRLFNDWEKQENPNPELIEKFIDEINKLLEEKSFPQTKAFNGVEFASETEDLLKQNPQGKELVRLNRMMLEDAYKESIVKNEFYWLWRSGIGGYNRHSRVWQKWLNRILTWWHSLGQLHGSKWTKGFEVYDLLNQIEKGENYDENWKKLKDLESWKTFHEMRDILIAELEQITISS